MSQPSLNEGFQFWRDEVSDLERPEKEVPYIPVIALVGIYTALRHTGPLTSYGWRTTVLENADAREALRNSLTSFHKDELDQDFEIDLERLEIEPGAAMQHQFAYHSLHDGLPKETLTISGKELFLAHTLGYAAHDHAVAFDPLRLYDQGPVAMGNFYPRTAALIAGTS